MAEDEVAALAPIWAEAERRLYPLATTNPDAYMQAIKLVRAVADRLGEVTSNTALAAQWDLRAALVDEILAGAETGLPAGAGADDVAAAGFSLRHAELRAEQEQAEQRLRIVTAREAGETWAVLHERSAPEAGLAKPYQCIELHLATGIAVISSVEPDPDTMRPNHVVAVYPFGDEHGEVAGLDLSGIEDRETMELGEFDGLRDEMRRLVEALGEQAPG
jgi:hypothetical protein